MKNKPLYIKIWTVTTVTISLISIAVAGIMYVWSSKYFENQLYSQIDQVQLQTATVAKVTDISPALKITESEDKNIKSGIISESIKSIPIQKIEVYDEYIIDTFIKDKIKFQKAEKQYYQENIDGMQAMYVIEQIETPVGLSYAYSFTYNPYRKMLNELFTIIVLAICVFLFISFIIIRIICKKMTHNISDLQIYADKIAFQDWNEPIDINRFNHSLEVSDLASSFEQMRKKLVQRDENMQSMLQYISHELKTPIMVIRSYIDAAKDGIYPKGNLESSLDTMENQSLRLQEKVSDLLYITKLENSKKNKNIWINCNICELLSEILSNYEFINKDLNIKKNLDKSIELKCDRQNISVLFENMLENVIRHANKEIIITLKKNKNQIRLLFYNDGEPISSDVKNKIFKPFEKGQNGNIGLGLSICNKIVEIHDGTIRIPHTKNGCIFIIDIPYIKNII